MTDASARGLRSPEGLAYPTGASEAEMVRPRLRLSVKLAVVSLAGLGVVSVLAWIDRVVIASWAFSSSTRLPLLSEVARPIPVLIVAAALIGVVLVKFDTWRPVTAVVVTLLVATSASATFPFLQWFSSSYSPRPESVVSAPNGPLAVAVYHAGDLIDDQWNVRVRSSGREQSIACLNSDSANGLLTDIAWSRPNTFSITTAGNSPIDIVVTDGGKLTSAIPDELRCS